MLCIPAGSRGSASSLLSERQVAHLLAHIPTLSGRPALLLLLLLLLLDVSIKPQAYLGDVREAAQHVGDLDDGLRSHVRLLDLQYAQQALRNAP